MDTKVMDFFDKLKVHVAKNPNGSLWGFVATNAEPPSANFGQNSEQTSRLIAVSAANDMALNEQTARRILSLPETVTDFFLPTKRTTKSGESPTLVSLLMFRHTGLGGRPTNDFSALVRLDDDVPKDASFRVETPTIPAPRTLTRMAACAYLNPEHSFVIGRLKNTP